jgi:hypothetical protein
LTANVRRCADISSLCTSAFGAAAEVASVANDFVGTPEKASPAIDATNAMKYRDLLMFIGGTSQS